MRRQVRNQCAAEVIRWAQSCRWAAQRRTGSVPVPFRALLFRKINGCQNLEPIVHPALVLFLNAGKSFHVRLPETEKHPKVCVLTKGARMAEQQAGEER